MLRINLSDSLLQTVFFPGALLLVAIGCAFGPSLRASLPPSVGDALNVLGGVFSSPDVFTKSGGALAAGILAVGAILAYLLAMFLGLLLAVCSGYLEYYLLDHWRAAKLDGEAEYQRQWADYLDTLEKAHNSYVTKQVTAFHFEARSGMALAALAAGILWRSHGTLWVLSLLSLLLAVGLFKAAIDDHRMLAMFRQRRFGRKPEATLQAEDALRALVELWCKRGQVRLLKLVLPVVNEDGKTISEPARACEALGTVVRLPDTEIAPSEKLVLSLAIAALSDRARNLKPPSSGLESPSPQ